MAVNWHAQLHSLATAELKYRRGQLLQSAVADGISKFAMKKPFRLVCDGRYSEHFWAIEILENLPIEVMMNAGDAIHSYRSALDHCAYALWEIDNAGKKDRILEVEKVYFPVCAKRRNFRRLVDELDLRSDAAEVFYEAEAFLGGSGDCIYHLSKLDNIDKHRILPAANMMVTISNLIIRSCEGNELSFEQVIAPVIVETNTNDLYTSLTNRAGDQLFGHQNLEPIPARLGRYIDESMATASIQVELAAHKPLIGHYCGDSLMGSLTAFSASVSSIIYRLKGVIHARTDKLLAPLKWTDLLPNLPST